MYPPLNTTDGAIGVHAMVLLDRVSLLLELASIGAAVLALEEHHGVTPETEGLRRRVQLTRGVVLAQLAALVTQPTMH